MRSMRIILEPCKYCLCPRVIMRGQKHVRLSVHPSIHLSSIRLSACLRVSGSANCESPLNHSNLLAQLDEILPFLPEIGIDSPAMQNQIGEFFKFMDRDGSGEVVSTLALVFALSFNPGLTFKPPLPPSPMLML